MSRIPAYNYLRADELPAWQLYKRWQKATSMAPKGDLLGYLSREHMLADIARYQPKLLQGVSQQRQTKAEHMRNHQND